MPSIVIQWGELTGTDGKSDGSQCDAHTVFTVSQDALQCLDGTLLGTVGQWPSRSGPCWTILHEGLDFVLGTLVASEGCPSK